MMIYKGKVYNNRKDLVKQIGANRFKNLLKYRDKDLIVIYNESIEGYAQTELPKNNRKGSR